MTKSRNIGRGKADHKKFQAEGRLDEEGNVIPPPQEERSQVKVVTTDNSPGSPGKTYRVNLPPHQTPLAFISTGQQLGYLVFVWERASVAIPWSQVRYISWDTRTWSLDGQP